ncbi:MAG: choice-of-anchor Q domain-containing protein [Betaproteobacteria bacterium]
MFKYGLPVVVPETAKSAKRAAHPALNAMIASGRAKVAAFRQDARMKAGRPRMKSASDPILYSTIIGGNGGAFDLECSNCIITGSDNLVQRVEPSTTVPLDTIVNQNPQLGPLAANGGFMNGASGHPLTGVIRTHLLFSDSPAIDRGSNPEGFSYDQRGFGFQRVVGGRADIGAIEGMLQRNNVPVPVVGPWLVALLSALVGVLGLRSRRRKA